MFSYRDVISILKGKKKDLELAVKNVLSKELRVSVLFENGHFTINVSEYASLNDFMAHMRKIDIFGVINVLSNSVLWNSEKQKVNKGTYYVIVNGDNIYNILVGENLIKIVEDVKNGQEVEERIITFSNGVQYFTVFRHDSSGSTYDTKYYNTKGECVIKEFEMSRSAVLEEFMPVIFNIKNLDGIDDMIDVSLLDSVFDLKSKKL